MRDDCAALAAASPVLISADGAVMSETLLGLLVALAEMAMAGGVGARLDEAPDDTPARWSRRPPVAWVPLQPV